MNLTKMRNMFKLLPFIYRGFKFENLPPGCRFTLCLKRSLKTMEMFIFMSSLASGNPNSSGKKHLFGKNLLLNMQNIDMLVCFFWWFLLVCFRDVSLLSDDSPEWLLWIKKSETRHAVGYPFSANGVVFVLKKVRRFCLWLIRNKPPWPGNTDPT